ncbi:hypothetical protein ISN44_As01g057010 [Arabidopsis suecica]|uniref:Uncharacterized protein n=1 Tax=Arabidopsis suecica TaxID=45249 RepID=A0A8T2HH75_ARASU|nr:hypothetical protein ISN44_As01g057010 [Arabidopsis suecica]
MENKMFYFASNGRFFLMILLLSSIAAVANGLTHLLMMIMNCGDSIDALSTTDPENMVKEVLKVGIFIQVTATFFGGFMFAFIRGLQLAFVLLSCINFSVDV